ncbi:hypothetical protein CGMCC3_g7943 [Colletotrichum fructicola]|nr:uncharacterized protein CGMCC3_g7943 [Colletotrichum fructicola]KAE9576033.1 hypothetical protein CGMCC3_g7943 [Colletotrichum fructicola]
MHRKDVTGLAARMSEEPRNSRALLYLKLISRQTITKSVAWATTIILSFYALGFERSNVNEEYLTAGQFWSGYLARASMMKKVIYFNTDLSPEAFLLVMIVYGAGASIMYHLHELHDRFQDSFLVAGIAIALISGTITGQTAESRKARFSGANFDKKARINGREDA